MMDIKSLFDNTRDNTFETTLAINTGLNVLGQLNSTLREIIMHFFC